ncbi:RING/U-box superfamily protein [Wolffia australiana]
MSTFAHGRSGGAAASAAAQYYCHQCERTVALPSPPPSELACPVCHGGFLEELESPAPESNPSPFPDGGLPAGFEIPLLFNLITSNRPAAMNIDELLGAFAGFAPPRSPSVNDLDPLNRTVQFVQTRLQDLIDGGANIQVVIENHPSGDFRVPGAPLVVGDYFFGSGLEQLIQQLAENDPNRYGTPPASRSAVAALPVVKITEELIGSDDAQCAVCKDRFEVGEDALQIPCKHLYHKDCILPWLELHNSCPVCRYELPTDDPEYEQRSRNDANVWENSMEGGGRGSRGSDSGSGMGGGQDSPGARTGERVLRLSLPWSIRSLFGIGSSAQNGESSADVDDNSGAGGGRGSGSEPRHEDLD